MPRDKKESFYSFDDKNKEVVFHRHDMPSPWMNYLTNETFYTMISQAGGNLSWYKSPEIWRIGRYGFFLTPTDAQGLFIYIKDKKLAKYGTPLFSRPIPLWISLSRAMEGAIANFSPKKMA